MAQNLNAGLGVDWLPGLQDGLISERGSDMIHEIGIACARCRTSDVFAVGLNDGRSQNRKPDCPVCGGDGWVFRDSLLVRGIATNIRQQNNVLDVGIVQPGDMRFSIGTSFIDSGKEKRHIAKGDRFIATWAQSLDEGQTVVRGAASMAEYARLVNSVTRSEDKLWYEPAEALWCEDENQQVYKQDADFVLGPGKVIRWTGNQPAIGTKYALKYTAYFEWLVFAPPFERVDKDNKDMGPFVFLRKRHAAYINDNPYITSSDRIPMSQRISC